MRKWAVVLVILLFAAGGVFWFWSLGSLPAPVVPRIHLHVTHEVVDVRSSGSDAWTRGMDGQELHEGDVVRTDVAGSATIIFDGKSESRLLAGSEVQLSHADLGGQSSFAVELKLVSGRVWNRVMRLLDLDDSFAIQANSVVATVRGTAFDLQTSATGTTLWVSDAAVQVTGGDRGSSPDTSLILTEGSVARFDGLGKVITTQQIGDDVRQSDWFLMNSNADNVFVRGVSDELLARYAALDATTPESLADKVAKLSERLHLWLSADQAPALYARYAARRLFAIKRLIDDGNSGQAFQALSSLEDDVTAHLSGSSGDAYRKAIRSSLSDMLLLMKDVGSSSPAYRMKQRLEDLNVQLAGPDGMETAYAHLLSIEARLDEAGSLIMVSSLDDAKNALDAARQGLQNVERDIDTLSDGNTTDRMHALRGKLDVLKARESAMRVRLATAITPPTGEITPSDANATSTPSVSVTPTTPASTAAVPTSTATAGFTKIELSAQPDPAQVGDKVRLSVLGVLPDGTKTDVTARSTFSLSGKLGTLNGPVYTATTAGSVTVNASYLDGTNKLSASHQLQIQTPPVTVSSLDVQSQGSTTLAYGSRTPIIVTAHYSDKTTKDVTSLANLVSSNPSIGSMVGNIFVSGKVAGTATISATYSEKGMTVRGTLDLLVAGP